MTIRKVLIEDFFKKHIILTSKYPPISLYGYRICCHDVPLLHQSNIRSLRQNKGPDYKKDFLVKGWQLRMEKKRFYTLKKQRRPPGAKFGILKNMRLILINLGLNVYS